VRVEERSEPGDRRVDLAEADDGACPAVAALLDDGGDRVPRVQVAGEARARVARDAALVLR
jgi:hypothetical protein